MLINLYILYVFISLSERTTLQQPDVILYFGARRFVRIFNENIIIQICKSLSPLPPSYDGSEGERTIVFIVLEDHKDVFLFENFEKLNKGGTTGRLSFPSRFCSL